MDNSREHDLLQLKKRFSDQTLPWQRRNRAYLKYQDIQSQIKDPILTKLRYRLSKAHGNSDQHYIDKLEQQIHAHEFRQRGSLRHW